MDDKLLTKLTPQVLRFQAQNRDPITIYITDSPGGDAGTTQNILRLIRLSDQDMKPPCKVITVVTTKAQSAAADLLSSGDYAIACPGCSLLYHGVRTAASTLQPLTAERSELLAHLLRMTNDAFAMELAKRAEDRFTFRFMMSLGEVNQYRKSHKAHQSSDVDCFVKVVSPKLSPGARQVFRKAHERYAKYEPLLTKFTSQRDSRKRKRVAIEEARRIKAIVDFETHSNKTNPAWTFKNGGMARLVEDFFLVAEYLESQQSDRLREWCKTFASVHLQHEEYSRITEIKDEETRNQAIVSKLQPLVGPLWSFFVALCHALQEDENELNATDAYWLGLVDEVLGTAMPTMRWFGEWRDDAPTPQPEPASAEKVDQHSKETDTNATISPTANPTSIEST
jgi:ATP-dependent protease ClpP protease subunit